MKGVRKGEGAGGRERTRKESEVGWESTERKRKEGQESLQGI